MPRRTNIAKMSVHALHINQPGNPKLTVVHIVDAVHPVLEAEGKRNADGFALGFTCLGDDEKAM